MGEDRDREGGRKKEGEREVDRRNGVKDTKML